jgi:hypothetical protein
LPNFNDFPRDGSAEMRRLVDVFVDMCANSLGRSFARSGRREERDVQVIAVPTSMIHQFTDTTVLSGSVSVQ